MAHCIGLGIYRRRQFTIEPKPCKRGIHVISGQNVALDRHGQPICRSCQEDRWARYYWSRQLALYWQSLAGTYRLVGALAQVGGGDAGPVEQVARATVVRTPRGGRTGPG